MSSQGAAIAAPSFSALNDSLETGQVMGQRGDLLVAQVFGGWRMQTVVVGAQAVVIILELLDDIGVLRDSRGNSFRPLKPG